MTNEQIKIIVERFNRYAMYACNEYLDNNMESYTRYAAKVSVLADLIYDFGLTEKLKRNFIEKDGYTYTKFYIK